MEKTLVYIGSYSSESGEGIYSFKFDGITVTPLHDPIAAQNPSYLSLSADGRFLYAVAETQMFQGVSGGGVAAYRIDGEGRLSRINARPTNGDDPCYLSQNKANTYLFAANYSSGSLAAFSLGKDGAVSAQTALVSHMGAGPNRERQEKPHVHFTDFTPDGKYLCAVDLGTDTVQFYRLKEENGELCEEESRRVTLRPGSGPRHVVFGENGRFLYVVTELSSQLAVFELENEHYVSRQYISTLPTDFKGENTAAAIRMSPDGRFLYASNRGNDSIACYRIGSDGLLTLCGIYATLGSGPRDFAMDPEGRFLLVANEKSNEVVVFGRNETTGALTPVGSPVSVHSPTCIVFFAPDCRPADKIDVVYPND